jgi:putative thioredoxin
MVGGKPVDGFMGAKPESEIKAFLDKHVPSPEALEAESDAEDASPHRRRRPESRPAQAA